MMGAMMAFKEHESDDSVAKGALLALASVNVWGQHPSNAQYTR